MTINDMILEKMIKAKYIDQFSAAKIDKIAFLVYGGEYAKPLRQGGIRREVAEALFALEKEGKVKNISARPGGDLADTIKRSKWMVV